MKTHWIGVAPHIVLQHLRQQHAHELFLLTQKNRVRLSRWLPWAREHTALAVTQAFIRQSEIKEQEYKAGDFAILVHNRIVGCVGMYDVAGTTDMTDVNEGGRSAAIGYWLGEEFEGQGIMVRAVRELTLHLLTELGFGRVEIRCAPDNMKSRAVPERLGFVPAIPKDSVEQSKGHAVDPTDAAAKLPECSSKNGPLAVSSDAAQMQPDIVYYVSSSSAPRLRGLMV